MKGNEKMKKIGTIPLIAAIVTLMMLSMGGLVFAGDYTVSWWHLQKRTYEDGRSYNRLGFGVEDEFGDPVSTDVVLSVALAGSGVPSTLPSHNFTYYDTLNGRIDVNAGWVYDAGFITENYFSVNFTGDLAQGDYTLTVTDTDGVVMTNGNPTQRFNGVVELPTISSKSFRAYEDASGGWICQWDPPMSTGLWTGSLNLSIRAWLSIYLGDAYQGEVYVSVPAILGGIYVPSNVVNLALQKGDNFIFGVHIRTNDNNNRYYANEAALTSLKPEHSGKTVVVPLL
jgi:hypothetical protein